MTDITEKKTSPIKTTLVGVVVKDSLDKTITVTVDRLVLHPLFKKHIKRRSRFLVHDEKNTGKIGDKVKIVEGRPVSKRKRWHLAEVITHNKMTNN